MKMKATANCYVTQERMVIPKSPTQPQETPQVLTGCGEREPVHIDGGNVNCSDNVERKTSSQITKESSYNPGIWIISISASVSLCVSEMKSVCLKDICPHVHYNPIHNNQEMEAT